MVSDYRIRKISDYLGDVNKLIADMEMNGFSKPAEMLKEVRKALHEELDKELGMNRVEHQVPQIREIDAFVIVRLHEAGIITTEEARRLLGLDKLQDSNS